MTGPVYDAALHLLDRQVVDCDGRLVCKVDDVELTVGDSGELVPTGLLVGLPALLPRFGKHTGELLTRTHARLFEAQRHRVRPDVIDLDLVADVTSEVHLSAARQELLGPREDGPSAPRRLRLGDLLGMPVAASPEHDLARRTRLLDVRLVAVPDGRRHVVDALIVGPGRPGALLGYDRRGETGPWLVADLVRWLHRHARIVGMGPAVEIDTEARQVRIGPGASVRPLLG